MIKERKSIEFARARGLIKTQKRCSNCKSRMEFEADNGEIDGFRWRCKNSRCRSSKSIRQNTFFSRSKLSMEKIFLIIYFRCKDYTIKQAVDELEISRKTMIDWYRFCRDIVYYHFQNEEITVEKIGGVGRIIEIDESVFSKRKYHRGRIVKET
jgi:hypothetical protein